MTEINTNVVLVNVGGSEFSYRKESVCKMMGSQIETILGQVSSQEDRKRIRRWIGEA